MKKSLRVLALVLAVVMTLSCGSVAASAYNSNYKGNPATIKNSVTYDDVNSAVYTTEQYAEMALDEVDRLLDSLGLGVIDIYVGTLALTDIDGTLASVRSLFAQVGTLLSAGILGDAALLNIDAINNTSRSKGDTQVLYDLLDLIGGLAPLAYKYVSGDISLGILDSFIADYVFDVRELVFGLLTGVAGLSDDPNYDYMSSREIPSRYQGTGKALLFAQDVLNKFVLGEWQKLDDIFYGPNRTYSHVAYDEIQFHDRTASGAIVTDALDTARYDYYGWVHPDNWVTVGLGDFIRVPEGAAAPAASAQSVDLQNLDIVYNFVEKIFLQAYNGILVPVLNRITTRWIRESLGYTFDDDKTTEFEYDSEGNIKLDANGESIINKNYDYLYMGEAPEVVTGEKIFRLFDVDNMRVPYYEVQSAGYESFVTAFNHNLGLFVDGIIKATRVKNGNSMTYTWTNPEDTSESYSFTWQDGSNSLLVDNVCSALKFLICVTGDQFFDQGIIERGEMKTPAEVMAINNNQTLLAYVLRSVINANVPYIYIPETNDTNTLAGVGMEACIQLAYQDIPQFTYTAPSKSAYSTDRAYYEAVVNKCLTILMDVAAYNLNQALDVNLNETATDSNYNITNMPGNNKTGLLGYLGDTGSYGTSVATIAAWAFYTWASTTYEGKTDCLIALDFGCDDYQGKSGTGKVTEATFWSDIDLLVNSIIPIDADNTGTSQPDNRPWINNTIASSSGSIAKTIVFDYLVYPILSLNVTNLEMLLTKNDNGAFAFDNIETVIIDFLHRLFDALLPGVFKESVTSLDSLLTNQYLAQMVSDLVYSLSASLTTTGLANGVTINGRGKTIVGVALPIVCMILGLSEKQEFGELENYLPSAATAGNITFSIYNGSSGVNTSYRNPVGFARNIDSLFTYVITSANCSVISGGSGTHGISGASNGTEIAGGQSVTCTISGAAAGEMLEVTFRYKVKDETGAYLNNGQELSSTAYCYVGESDKGDDEKLATKTIGGQTIQYVTDMYLKSGDSLSKVAGFNFRIEDSASSQTTVQITNARLTSGANTGWVAINDDASITTQTMSGQGGTYVFSPFSVNDEAYKRTEFEYSKDEDGSYILDNYGNWIKTAVATPEAGVTFVPDGEYVATTTIKVGSTTDTITTRIHIYNDFNLVSLVNSCISANLTMGDISSAGQQYWNTYYNALKSAAAFALQPNTHGANFNTYIGATGNGTINESNQYKTLYQNLYAARETINNYRTSSGAQSLWNKVNSLLPYNWTRASYQAQSSSGTTTVYFRDYAEYYETGYGFVGMRNYVAHTYKEFKDAVNYANGLIDREYKFVWASAEDYDKMTTEEKENFKKDVDNYLDQVENAGIISSVEAAYAEHKLDLAYNRMIALSMSNSGSTYVPKSKLNDAITKFGNVDLDQKAYSTGSKAAYQRAVTFANSTKNDSSATFEQLNWALSKLVEAWKGLAAGADYADLIAAISAAKNFLNSDCDGWGLSGTNSIVVSDADNQELYTPASFAAYLEAIKIADQFVADYNNGKGLAVSDQTKIDNAATAIAEAKEALAAFGSDAGEATFELNIEFEFEYDSGDTYAPVIDEDIMYDSVELEYVEIDGEEYELTGVITGICTDADEDILSEMFIVEGCSVEFTPSNTRGAYGTGSYVIITDDSTDEVMACYLIAIRGDLNGDGKINASDKTPLSRRCAYMDGYMYDDPEADECFKFVAADINGSGTITNADYTALNMGIYGVRIINQPDGGYVTT